MAKKLALKVGADLVLATDPDGDRVGILDNEAGAYRFIDGNEIASLLLDYFLIRAQSKSKLDDSFFVVSTVVTSPLQRKIADAYGVHYEETFTGFKWICKTVKEYETGERLPKRKFLCGGEESYGFLAGDMVRDKDGILACCLVAEMKSYYLSRGKSLLQARKDLYKKHGIFNEKVFTHTFAGVEGLAQREQLMAFFRKTPLDLPVIKTEDFLEKKPQADLIQFFLKDGTRVCIRPSGTEPKLKFYLSVTEAVPPGCSEEEFEGLEKNCDLRNKNLETFLRNLIQGSL
jgi:phosphoglucomutase